MNETEFQFGAGTDLTDGFLEFRLGSRYYGTSLENVREISRMVDITPVPRTSRALRGIMNLRGGVLPVVDLNERLGNGPTQSTRDTSIIVVQSPRGRLGVLVDAVHRVLPITPDTKRKEMPPTDLLEENALVAGLLEIGSSLLTLLDLTRCLPRDFLTPEAVKKERARGNEAVMSCALKMLG